jgi:hypothetical protein
MCDRNDYDLARINDVDDVILECAQPSFTHRLCERFAGQRAFSDERRGDLQVAHEPITQTLALLVEILNRFVNFCLGWSQKPDACHFLRA